MITEEKAREKWCPFTRVGEQASGAAENRPDGTYNCIASGCMVWVQTDNMYEPQSPTDASKPRSKPAGYCGLAREPK